MEVFARHFRHREHFISEELNALISASRSLARYSAGVRGGFGVMLVLIFSRAFDRVSPRSGKPMPLANTGRGESIRT